jgi:hypothetical protein
LSRRHAFGRRAAGSVDGGGGNAVGAIPIWALARRRAGPTSVVGLWQSGFGSLRLPTPIADSGKLRTRSPTFFPADPGSLTFSNLSNATQRMLVVVDWCSGEAGEDILTASLQR